MRDRPRDRPRLADAEFTRLVDAHQHRLLAFLVSLVGQHESALDLMQETFYDAWRAAQHGDPPFLPGVADAEARRWLFRAGYHHAISWLRRQRLIRFEPLEAPGGALCLPAAGAAFEDRLAEGEAIRTALSQLAHDDVACLILRVVEDFSAAEVAAILRTTPANVHTRLARARQRLRAAYFQTGMPEEQRHR